MIGSTGLLLNLLLVVLNLALEDEFGETSEEHVVPIHVEYQQYYQLVDQVVLTV